MDTVKWHRILTSFIRKQVQGRQCTSFIRHGSVELADLSVPSPQRSDFWILPIFLDFTSGLLPFNRGLNL